MIADAQMIERNMEVDTPSARRPLLVPDHVQGDAANPRAQPRSVLELAETREHLQVHVLAHVVDFLATQQGERQSGDRRPVCSHELTDRPVVASQTRRDERPLVRLEPAGFDDFRDSIHGSALHRCGLETRPRGERGKIVLPGSEPVDGHFASRRRGHLKSWQAAVDVLRLEKRFWDVADRVDQHFGLVGRLMRYMNGLPMAEVLPAALPGDSVDRLSALVDAHYDRLYRLARRLVPTSDDARDLVKETFLKAARSPRAVPLGATDGEAWLVCVLVNIRRDQWRKAAVRARHVAEVQRSAIANDDQEAAFVARATVWRALDLLTPRRRAVVVMHELEGLAVPAIASQLGVSAITVRWHLAMGRRDLARVLAPQMGEPDENH